MFDYYCEPGGTLEKDYQVEVVDFSILGEECKEQMYLLESESIAGPVYDSYLESIIHWDSHEAEVEGESEETIYDFNAALEDYIGPCEEAGGYLYKISEVITEVITNLDFYAYGNYDQGYTLLNYPICLGSSSCVAKVYFDEFFVPTQQSFKFEKSFWDAYEKKEPYYIYIYLSFWARLLSFF